MDSPQRLNKLTRRTFLTDSKFLEKNLKFLSSNPSAHTLPETFTRGLCGLLKLTVSKTESNPYTTPKYCFSLSKKRLQGPLDGGVILSSNTKPGSYLMKSTTRITTWSLCFFKTDSNPWVLKILTTRQLKVKTLYFNYFSIIKFRIPSWYRTRDMKKSLHAWNFIY